MKSTMTPVAAFGFAALWLTLAIWAALTDGSIVYVVGSVLLAIALVVFGLRARRRARAAESRQRGHT